MKNNFFFHLGHEQKSPNTAWSCLTYSNNGGLKTACDHARGESEAYPKHWQGRTITKHIHNATFLYFDAVQRSLFHQHNTISVPH